MQMEEGGQKTLIMSCIVAQMNTCRHITHKHTPAGSKTSSMTGGRRNPQSMVVVATGLGKWGGVGVGGGVKCPNTRSDNGQKTRGTHTALRGMSGSTRTVLRRSIHPETHTQIHTDQFNIPLNNCRHHRLTCL